MMHYNTHAKPVTPGMAVSGLPLKARTLRSLADLNREFLGLLEEQASLRSQANPLLRELGVVFRHLSSTARQRVARCPYLLADVGFSELAQGRGEESEQRPFTNAPFFTVRQSFPVVHHIFLYAWHLSQSRNLTALALIGVPRSYASFIGKCTLSEIRSLAERHCKKLRPRWPNLVGFWRELLLSGASGNAALESARMHGVQLLAAELGVMCIEGLESMQLSQEA